MLHLCKWKVFSYHRSHVRSHLHILCSWICKCSRFFRLHSLQPWHHCNTDWLGGLQYLLGWLLRNWERFGCVFGMRRGEVFCLCWGV